MKAIKKSLILIFILLLFVYGGGIFVFSNYFFPSTQVNGHDMGLTKIADLKKNYDKISEEYFLNIESKRGRERIDSKDFDYEDKLIEDKVSQNPFYWFISILVPNEYNLKNESNYNEKKLEKAIFNLRAFKNMEEPKDAEIIFKDNKFVIEDEVEGTSLKVADAFKEIKEAIEKGKENLDLNEFYLKPKIYRNDPELKKVLDEKNELLNLKITYKFGEKSEILQGEELADLYEFDGQGLMLNGEKVKAYIRGLSNKYDTFKKDRNFYATNLGPAIVKGGIYGWLTDIEASTKSLINALNEKKDKEMTLDYKLEASQYGPNDIGRKYLEIDLARQHMWYYEDGKLIIESDVVTGNPSKNNGTPTGTGRIWSKERDRFLSGEDYKSHVNYWMPFNWSGCGLHDATWRNKFGGQIYKVAGSHGCVNTPPENMKLFFEKIPLNTPVVVYDSSDPNFKIIK